MQEHSSMHVYLNWSKQRIDEMDAALASLEAKVSQLKADSKAKADHLLADLKERQHDFQAKAKAQAQAGEATLHASKAQLELQWHGFETQLKTYIETVGKQVQQQQATFRDVATAQMKAWHEATDKLHNETAKIAAAKRADVDAAVKQMKADAAEAEARLHKLKQAGSESWSALSAALTESAPGVRSSQPKGLGRTQARRSFEILSRAAPDFRPFE